MSFIDRGINGKEPDQSGDLEEQYKKLMPKIGRDFVSIGDLEEMLRLILDIIDPLGLNPLSLDTSSARELAQNYKRLVENGKDGGESKRDLVKIDEDEED